ncbi:4781_t:CDS:2 [Gigaspora rosea]|nr:4781_t:CDS:2 [Gigaspora rosea]
MKFITVLVIITLSVYLINALPTNLTKGQETTIVPHEHKLVEQHKKLEKRAIEYVPIENFSSLTN